MCLALHCSPWHLSVAVIGIPQIVIRGVWSLLVVILLFARGRGHMHFKPENGLF